MTMAHQPPVLQFLRHLAVRQQLAELSDGELLQRFLNKQEQEALVVLMRRHGGMVYRACLQVLHNEHDAEDAFQATFLVLSRKGASVKRQPSLGSWLFGVAHHVAANLKRSQARRRMHENQVGQPDVVDPLSTLLLRDAQAILNEELARLPERYRAPLVLCSLEGLTRDEAVQHLGVPLGTFKSRLERARQRLRLRLTVRGLLPAGALVASVLEDQTGRAAMPAALGPATIQAMRALAAGQSVPDVVSAQAATLTREVLKAMSMLKFKVAALVVLAAGFLAAGAGLLAMPSLAAQKPAGPSERSTTPPRETKAESGDAALPMPQISCRMGDIVYPRFFVRNAGKGTLHVAVPRLMTHSYYRQVRLTDARGREIPVQKPQQPGGPVGWLAFQLGKGNQSEIRGEGLRIGRPAAEEPGQTVLPVKPGHIYRLQYTLDNYGNQKLGQLKTGEFTFVVLAADTPKARQPTAQEMEKHIAWGKPAKNHLQAGVALWPNQAEQPATQRQQGQALDEAVLKTLHEARLPQGDLRRFYATLYRRLFLDLLGRIPSRDEAKRFIEGSGKKRAAAIEKVLKLAAAEKHWTAEDEKRARAALLDMLLDMDR